MQDLVQSALPPSAYEFPGDPGERRARRLPADAAQPAGRRSRSTPSFRSRATGRCARPRDDASLVPGPPPVLRRPAGACAGHRREVHRGRARPRNSALMFLPSEAVYAELHANFPALVEESFRSRVWIVSPTTLMATLTTVRAVLQGRRICASRRTSSRPRSADCWTTLSGSTSGWQSCSAISSRPREDVRQIRISTEKVGRRAERIEELQVGDVERRLSPRRGRSLGRSAGSARDTSGGATLTIMRVHIIV